MQKHPRDAYGILEKLSAAADSVITFVKRVPRLPLYAARFVAQKICRSGKADNLLGVISFRRVRGYDSGAAHRLMSLMLGYHLADGDGAHKTSIGAAVIDAHKKMKWAPTAYPLYTEYKNALTSEFTRHVQPADVLPHNITAGMAIAAVMRAADHDRPSPLHQHHAPDQTRALAQKTYMEHEITAFLRN